jgi:small-conductance mechanosensitive channel
MSNNIFTDDFHREVLEQAQKEAVKQVVAQLVPKVIAAINANQVASEVKNKAATEASKYISDLIWKKLDVNAAIKRAIGSIEGRINQKVKDQLAKGISIKFFE